MSALLCSRALTENSVSASLHSDAFAWRVSHMGLVETCSSADLGGKQSDENFEG